MIWSRGVCGGGRREERDYVLVRVVCGGEERYIMVVTV